MYHGGSAPYATVTPTPIYPPVGGSAPYATVTPTPMYPPVGGGENIVMAGTGPYASQGYQSYPHPSLIQWVPMSHGRYPMYAIQAGFDSGREMYVARAHHNGGIVPGKLHAGHHSAYISYDMVEVPKDNYEVLVAPVASLSWIDGQGSHIHPQAVIGGHDPSGEPYYIGRVWLNGTITVGKVHRSHGVCYVPYGGVEHSSPNYEILVKNALGRALGV